MLCGQFSILLQSGLPLARAVELSSQHCSNRALRRLLHNVAKDVKGGQSLSGSFSARGAGILPEAFVEMLYAGEAAGNLSAVFAAMRDHFDRQKKASARVRAAMFYPMFVLAVAIIVVAVMMSVVVPRFAVIFGDAGASLPLPTLILMNTAAFFRRHWKKTAFLAVSLFLAVNIARRTERGKILLARLELHLPILGGIQRLHAAGRFADTLAVTLSAGLPMTKAVFISVQAMEHAFLRERAGVLRLGIEAGRSLAEAMRESRAFPEILVDMCSMGERSGELERTLRAAAAYYDAELDEAVSRALSRLEPALLILIAGIAGFIVLAIYMAVFALYGTM